MANDYWFPCFVNDLLGSFTWRAMTNEERGAYWQLICYQMQTSDGMLPGEINVLNRLAELDLNEHPLVLAKFPETDCGKRANARALEVWTDKATKSEKARTAVQSRYERSTNVVRTKNERSTDVVRTKNGRSTDEEPTKNGRTTNVLRTQVQRARVSESESESQSESETRDPQTPKGAKSKKKFDSHESAIKEDLPRIDAKGTEFASAFMAYCSERANRREWMTPRAVELLLGTLDKYDKEVAVEALNQSVMNGWQGVFPERVAADAARSGRAPKQAGVDVRFDELSEAQKQAIRERSGRI